MDQIYISKNRTGLDIGDYVIIKPLENTISPEKTKSLEKLYYYNIEKIEPLKLKLIKEIINLLEKNTEPENIIITGSFLDKGFSFNDIDIIIIKEKEINKEQNQNYIEDKTGIKTHIIALSSKTLVQGLSSDPLYQMMLSKCISKKRIIYKTKNKINYKLLDLRLLKNKTLKDNFDFLNGNEKYYLIRNLIAISLYLEHKKITAQLINKKIKKAFNLKDTNQIKQNLLNKKDFLKKYNSIYNKTFNKIMESIKNDSKQK